MKMRTWSTGDTFHCKRCASEVWCVQQFTATPFLDIRPQQAGEEGDSLCGGGAVLANSVKEWVREGAC